MNELYSFENPSSKWTYKFSDNILYIYRDDKIYAENCYQNIEDILYFLAMVINSVLLNHSKEDVINIMHMTNIIVNYLK